MTNDEIKVLIVEIRRYAAHRLSDVARGVETPALAARTQRATAARMAVPTVPVAMARMVACSYPSRPKICRAASRIRSRAGWERRTGVAWLDLSMLPKLAQKTQVCKQVFSLLG